MGGNQKKDRTEYDLDQLIRSSYGLSDDQLLEKMEQAEQMISDAQIPPPSEDDFFRLMEKAEELSITPESEHTGNTEDPNGEGKAETRKIRRLGPVIKTALVAAVVASMLVMTSMTVGARKAYEYAARDNKGIEGNVIINNEPNENKVDSLEEAYKTIDEKLGIRTIKIRNKFSNMTYLRTVFNERQATMYFDLDGEMFFLMQRIRTSENSVSISSDRDLENTVYNEWLGINISIGKAYTDDNKEEYSASIILNNAYYYLSGVTDIQTFTKIVKDLKFRE